MRDRQWRRQQRVRIIFSRINRSLASRFIINDKFKVYIAKGKMSKLKGLPRYRFPVSDHEKNWKYLYTRSEKNHRALQLGLNYSLLDLDIIYGIEEHFRESSYDKH